MSGPLLKDAKWMRQSFLVGKSSLEAIDQKNRVFSTASLKFTDTTPGGNFAINPAPSFTETADPSMQGKFAGSKGMGLYYSEAIDDNAQIIHMRFGVPEFNSLRTFFTQFYDSQAGQIARTGRVDKAFYLVGRAIGLVVQVAYWPLLAAAYITGKLLRFALAKPSTKFYYLKPTMVPYWNAVQTMVNQLAVNRGIIPRLGGDPSSGRFGADYDFDDATRKKLHSLLPDIISETGQIDVYAMANRAQRLAYRRQKMLNEGLSSDDIWNEMADIHNKPLTDERPVWSKITDLWLSNGKSESQEKSTAEAATGNSAPAGFAEFEDALMNDGNQFASFKVNYTGPVSDSFSSQVGESEISSKINGMASASRSSSFNFANGNISDDVASTMLGAVFGAAKNVVAGVADQLGISGMAVLGGAAFVDIPKHWQSSATQLGRTSYTIDLVSPYGNPISQLFNLYIPLCMLMAGALPLSTGKHSYTSPFLVEMYDQGRAQTRLGIIDSMNITRGKGNLGFNNDGKMMGLEVTFTVMDLSSIMHMPISEGLTFNGAKIGAVVGGAAGAVAGGISGSAAGPAGTVAGATVGATVGAAGGAAIGGAVDTAVNAVTSIAGLFDDDTVWSDYLNVVAGVGLADQIYSLRKLKMRATNELANWKSAYSASHLLSFMGDTPPARLWSAVYKGTEK